jgi:hypothetical protein
MIAAIIQLVVGAVLLGCVVWVKLRDVDEAVEMATRRSKLKQWRKALITIALSLLGTATLLDPLIPGIANLTVRVPTGRAAYRGLPEHLRVKVVPLGLRGLAGGDRISDAPFGSDGSVQIVASLSVMETHVTLEVYDETSPSVIIQSDTVYISPFVRRQLIGKTITFCKTGETMTSKVAGYVLGLSAIAILAIASSLVVSAATEFQILSPRANSVVPGQVVEISGVGADPTGSVEVEVLTNDWYPQTGKARVNADGTWTYSPVFLSGQGPFNNHTIKASIVKDGRRAKSVSVGGVVRKQ